MKTQIFHNVQIRKVMERLRDFLNFRSSNLNTTLIYGLMDNLYPCLKHTLSLSVFSTEFSNSGEILCKAYIFYECI